MNGNEAIVVFTARSPERIIREGGSQAWVLNAVRAKQCTWLVCTQNRHHPDPEFSDATEPHGTAFLVGRISRITKSADEDEGGKQRWLINISEFARINVPDAWDHGRNPVRYMSRAELAMRGVKLDDLEFQRMPERSAAALPPAAQVAKPGKAKPLTIAEARAGLAATFGVKPEAVEITIRG